MPRLSAAKSNSMSWKAGQHHDVLDDAGSGLAADPNQLETVTVQMQRMNVVARIAESQPIAPSLLHPV